MQDFGFKPKIFPSTVNGIINGSCLYKCYDVK